MKTLKFNTVRIKNLIEVISISVILVACSNSPAKRSENDAAANQTQIAKPGMDIYAAAFMGNTKELQAHIEAGSDLNAKDAYGSTPLIIATVFGKTDAALLLIKAGADLNMTNSDGSTALHNAAFFCRPEIVKALLEHGADKNLKNNFGSTALESVSGSFDEVKPVYDQLSKDLGPLGLKLDYTYLEKTRPEIAEMLK